MAGNNVSVTFHGFTKRPETVTSKNGKEYSKYSIRALTGKDKEGKAKYSWFSCMDFTGEPAPADDSLIEVTGELQPEQYTGKDGKERYDLKVIVRSRKQYQRTPRTSEESFLDTVFEP